MSNKPTVEITDEMLKEAGFGRMHFRGAPVGHPTSFWSYQGVLLDDEEARALYPLLEKPKEEVKS